MATTSLHIYRGYSSYEYLSTKSFSIYDVKLVELDILNYIFTPLGTRLRLPHYGTRIQQLLFQPLIASTLADIRTELEGAFAYDPRVELVDLQLIPSIATQTVVAECVLYYIELNETVPLVLNLQFNQ
jgi:phage baseplate assembly protein W